MKRNWIVLILALFLSLPVQAAQHDYFIEDNPGVTVREDVNNALSAIASNNAGASAPSTTYPDMWWMDTSTNILKQRTHANDAWTNVASKSGSNWIPYRNGTLVGTASTLTTSTDGTLAANSDSNVATQKAVKTYADAISTAKLSKATSGEINAMAEKTDPVNDDFLLLEDSEASYAKKKVRKSNLATTTTYVAGSYLIAGPGVWRDNYSPGSSYVKIDEFYVARSGVLTVKFWFSKGNIGSTAYARIYINGSAVGTERTSGSGPLNQYSENITVAAGDLVQLYTKGSDGSTQSDVGAMELYENVPIKEVNTSPFRIFSGNGAPEATLGLQGDLYLRKDGSTVTTLYVKTDSSAWTAK